MLSDDWTLFTCARRRGRLFETCVKVYPNSNIPVRELSTMDIHGQRYDNEYKNGLQTRRQHSRPRWLIFNAMNQLTLANNLEPNEVLAPFQNESFALNNTLLARWGSQIWIRDIVLRCSTDELEHRYPHPTIRRRSRKRIR